MRLTVMLLLLFWSLTVKSQHLGHEKVPEDSLENKEIPLPRLVFFIAPEFEYSYFFERFSSNAGLSVGVLWRNRIEFSLFGRALLNDYQKRVIFPGVYTFSLVHGGVAASFWYPVGNRFHIQTGLKGSYGQMSWTSNENATDKFIDAVYFVTPHVGVSYSMGQYVKLQCNLGYQKIFDLSLVGVQNSDFDNFNIWFSVLVGNFEKQ